MKVISSFLWSESHEHNVLWTKLSCESDGVDEWVAIQSPFTFRGELKKANIEGILSESRFDSFRDRVKVITIQENLFEKLCSNHSEKEYFKVEFASRAACWEYVSTKYKDEDRVIIGDVDELIDFSDSDRIAKFFQICDNSSEAFQLEQLKYWWGFSNLSFYPKFMPVHTVGTLKSGKTSFTHRNNDCKQIKLDDIILAFEYAYSFSLEENFRKCSTFAHDRYTMSSLIISMALNSWHRDLARGEQLGRDPYDWFETIQLTSYNSPLFVLENFDQLEQNIVNADYANARVSMGYQPHPALNYGFLGKNKISKGCNYYK